MKTLIDIALRWYLKRLGFVAVDERHLRQFEIRHHQIRKHTAELSYFGKERLIRL